MTKQENGSQEYNFTPEQKLFVEKAKAAAQQTLIRGILAQPDSPSYPDKLKVMGSLWRLARRAARRTVKGTAKRTGIPWQDLTLFEGGLIDPQDLKEGFIDNLGQALGSPETLEAHKIIFGLPNETKKE